MLNMKRSFIYLFILLFLGSASAAFAQSGEIYGTVTDEKNTPFEGVYVKVTQGGLQKGMVVTESDGSFSVKPLQPGTYDVEFSSQGYGKIVQSSVLVSAGGTTKLKQRMNNDPKVLGEVIKVAFKNPLVNKITVVDAKTIERAPTTDLNDMASLAAGTYQSRNGAGLNIGGARTDGTVYILDGQVISGPTTPAQGTVDQLQVITSGIPANYGDATGGIVSITSKGMTQTLRGSIRAQHSIDGYNQNLLNASVTGPIISRTKDGVKQPILGFLAGVDYQYDADQNPTYIKNNVLKGDVLKNLQDNPLTLISTSNGPLLQKSSTFVTSDDFVQQKRSINNSGKNVRFNGKLDYAVNNKINITAGGTFDYSNSQGYSRSASYFAPDAIPTTIDYTGRGYIRFKQSFGQQQTKTADGKEVAAVISNAYYTVQLDYSTRHYNQQDPNFKHDLFKYGYVGKFTQSRVPVYAAGKDSLSGRDGIILQTLDGVNGLTFQPSTLNTTLANYTNAVYKYFGSTGAIISGTALEGLGGMLNGDFPTSPLSVQNVSLTDVGAGQTGYVYGYSNQFGLHADASFDFKPKKTVHAIQFGLYYEQRTAGSYSANINKDGTGTAGSSLWNVMSQLANRHIGGLDYSNPIFIHNGVKYTKDQVDAGTFFLPTDTIIYNRKDNGTQSQFDKSLRAKLGAGANDYLDVMSVDPSQLSLKMFSADELLNSGKSFVSYQGYDYTGNKMTGQSNFNDFFTAKDAAGNYTRPIAAFHPNYMAGYLMDAFRFQDMKFNIGVRVERYDASTKVLKDPYSLYETAKAGDIAPNRPSNIGSDYTVYVNNNQVNNSSIIGYRNGDTWYDRNGVIVADPTILKTTAYGGQGSDPQPALTTDGQTKITSANYDPNKSFTDYKPQVNVMPRFQFNFPINDGKALFYAHYDILVQRPKTGNNATAMDYYFLDQNQGQIIGNPDLKPEKTFDYEFGYQQELSKQSALGLSAFYKERKDQIQIRPYLYAWPRTYYTYGNRDFSSTKGFTFKYDYRKIDKSPIPIELTLTYTLQFAEGTGSNANSGNGGSGSTYNASGLLQNFISAGLPNLRYVSALSYDSRHVINLNLNYSYDENEGPTVNGQKPLQNFNANMIFRARSGEPYTTYANVVGNTIEGGLNGTRLPWHFGIDLRIDKRFSLNGIGKKPVIEGAKASHKYYLTAYIYFQNLFNIRDILGVYAYTSRPDDDGYVTSPTGQQYFNATTSAKTLQDLYSLYVNNPYNYNGPRRINIGFSFGF